MRKSTKSEKERIDRFVHRPENALELAKKRGVAVTVPSLVESADDGAPAAPPPVSKGWMAKLMPVAAVRMVEMKRMLGDFYPGALENLRQGKGYVVDETTWIAVGNPPLELFERGKVEVREGFTIMRVRPKIKANGNA